MNAPAKYKVGILGATGAVGQRFVELLRDHPWFEVAVLGASQRSAGKLYGEACKWTGKEPLNERIGALKIVECNPDNFLGAIDLVFSALDATVASQVEHLFADSGVPVFSNAKSHRYDSDVPILIPFVNSEHIHAIKQQKSFRERGAFIVTNANCASTGLCVGLGPLRHINGGIERLFVSTLQAVSGAGYPGLPSLDILDNVVPFIDGEEEKVEFEPKKILGTYSDEVDGPLRPADIGITALCHRVSVTDGHVVSVSIKFKESVADPVEAVKKAYSSFEVPELVKSLPSCPRKVIEVFTQPDRPQPRLDRLLGDGMTTSVGRIRKCNLLDVKLVTVAHNTIIGAAGGSILNAELAHVCGYLKKRHYALS